MVGTGVFTSLGFQVTEIPSGFPILLMWLLGGVISICGAVCYAELGAMLPRSGGEYHLIREAWHPLPGFLAGWVSITVGFAAPVAAAAVALGAYLAAITGLHPFWFSIPVVVVVTLIHLGSVHITGWFQVVVTTAKVLLIAILTVFAFLIGSNQGVSFLPVPGDVELIRSPAFATSLVFVMYAYAGWNGAAYIAGEIKDPEHNLPLSLILGTSIVTVLYVALNAAFLYSTPIDAMAGHPEVGLVAARSVFGERGGTWMGALISFGLISTISSMTWAGPRVSAMMGEDYRIFAWLSQRNRFGVPHWGILCQMMIVLALTCSMRFEQLIHYIQSILILSGMLTVLGMGWMRFRRPDLQRPWRVPFVIVPISVFTGMSIYMLYFQAQRKPFEVLMGVETLIAGAMVYVVAIWWQRKV